MLWLDILKQYCKEKQGRKREQGRELGCSLGTQTKSQALPPFPISVFGKSLYFYSALSALWRWLLAHFFLHVISFAWIGCKCLGAGTSMLSFCTWFMSSNSQRPSLSAVTTLVHICLNILIPFSSSSSKCSSGTLLMHRKNKQTNKTTHI